MDLNKYQELTSSTAVYDVSTSSGQPGEAGVTYCALALCGEAGELANKVKKVLRHDISLFAQRGVILDELGDCLWYIAQLANCLDAKLDDVAQQNLDKLTARKQAGTIHGSGDKR